MSSKLSDQFCVSRFSTLGNLQEGVQSEDSAAGVTLCGQRIRDFPNGLYRQLNDTTLPGMHESAVRALEAAF